MTFDELRRIPRDQIYCMLAVQLEKIRSCISDKEREVAYTPAPSISEKCQGLI